MNVKSLYPIIVVEDLEASKAFYCDIMNFSVKHDAVRKDGGHVLILSNEKDLQIELMEKPQAGPFQPELGLYGFRMNVDDIDAAYAELKEAGYSAPAGILETTLGKNLMFKDANGVNITLIQHIKK